MGKPACQEIRFGKGVCGTAAASQKTLVVPDVEEFPGHIACDAESRSEIVVPILVRGEVSSLSNSLWHTLFVSDLLRIHILTTILDRPLPLSILIAPNPMASTTWTRSTWKNWPRSWLKAATGDGSKYMMK